MNKFKIVVSWIMVLLIMGLIFKSFISIFLSPIPPIRYSHIPKETIDFIKHITDQGIVVNNHPKPDDWNNDKPGEDYLKEYKSIEDANFIIYYLPEKILAARASITLKNANSAITPLERMMGVYFYPDKQNNRKLPIFLTNSAEEYNSLIQHFIHNSGGGSTGITCFELSSFGFRTLGIVLSKDIWVIGNEDLARIVLWHEMNHYVFFTALDIVKNPAPLKWVTEGTAEYFAENTSRLHDVDKTKCSGIHLSNELNNQYDNYWVGYTALLGAEKTYGKATISNFIRQNFISPVRPCVQSVFKTDIGNFENGWRSYVSNLP